MLYHYASEADADELVRRGYRVARAGDVVALAPPRMLAREEALG
jgi:hypothetical protein